MVIYKTTNLINGKIYIGQDSRNNPNYYGSGKVLKSAISKYGKENFQKEILEYCATKDELNEREIYWIQFYKSNISGYNISTGGNGGNLGNVVNDKISKTIKLMYNDPDSIYNSTEYRLKLSGAKKGHVVTEETKEKISNAQKGVNGYWYGKKNDGHSKKMKEKYKSGDLCPWNKGLLYNDDIRNKISESHKGQIPWNKGKKDIYSQETRKKMSEAKKGKTRPDLSEKLKKYYSENVSSKGKAIEDTRTHKIYTKVKDLREDLGLSEYMVKQLINKGILIWIPKK